MNLCKKSKDMLALFAENELLPEDEKFVRKHLENCETCRLELEQYQSIIQTLKVEKVQIPDGYSSELIVNINEKLHKQKSLKLKLIPAISLAVIALVFSLITFLSTEKINENGVYTNEYLLYKQYTGNASYNDNAIYTESEEIADELMPQEFYNISREYILENSAGNTDTYVEVFSELDDKVFEEIVDNLKNIEI